MGYRRAKSDARYARRWRSFRDRNAALFERAGLPGRLADHAEFSYFVEHSYVPMPGEGETGSMFDVDQLDEVQRAALRTLIAMRQGSGMSPDNASVKTESGNAGRQLIGKYWPMVDGH